MNDFDWVAELAACSPVKIFQTLKLQVKEDVKTRQAVRLPDSPYGFSVAEHNSTFTVSLESNRVHEQVTFNLTETGISISDANGNETMIATLTLNDEGKCRLSINGRERELWQFRKMALEKLFFDTFRAAYK